MEARCIRRPPAQPRHIQEAFDVEQIKIHPPELSEMVTAEVTKHTNETLGEKKNQTNKKQNEIYFARHLET